MARTGVTYHDVAKAAQHLKLQKETAVLSERHQAAANTVKELMNQNKTLVHEKWFLGQEKAQLIGKLRALKPSAY